MDLIGISIAIGSAIMTLVVLGWEFQRSRRQRPTQWIPTSTRRFGVKWRTDSQKWAGLEQALFAIEHVLIRRYGADVVRKKKLLEFWLEIYPKNATIRTSNNPSGRVGGRTVNGAIDRISLFFGLKLQYVVLVMQHHQTKTRLPNGETWQEGELLDAGASALFHEVAEHYVPLILKRDINARHADEWKLLTTEMRQAHKLLLASEVAA